jgi:hypothetical protein
MAQIVKPELPQTCLFECRLHVAWLILSGQIVVPDLDGNTNSSAILILPSWKARSKALSLWAVRTARSYLLISTRRHSWVLDVPKCPM